MPFFFLALFSFQDAGFVVFGSFYLVKRLIYYTTFSEVCQVFFQTFSKLFLDSVVFRSARCCISRSACKLFYYTTFQEVCQEVFQIFSNLFSLAGLMARPSALLCDSRPAWQRTYLLYHISDRLSRVFFKISFEVFLSTRFSKALRRFNFPEVASLSDLSSSRSRLTALLLYHGFLKKSRLFYVKNAGCFFDDFIHISTSYIFMQNY